MSAGAIQELQTVEQARRSWGHKVDVQSGYTCAQMERQSDFFVGTNVIIYIASLQYNIRGMQSIL